MNTRNRYQVSMALAMALALGAACGNAGTPGVPKSNPDLAKGNPGPNPDLAMGGNPGDDMANSAGDDMDTSNDLAMNGQVTDMAGNGFLDLGCKPPTNLHPPKPGMPSIYCPFSAMPGGKNVYCMQGQQQCCEPAMGTSACQSLNMACAAGDVAWQCEDTTDCPGKHCCAYPAMGFPLKFSPGGVGCANAASHFGGTRCEASCGNGEWEICTNSNQCGGGKTCTPFASHGNQVGACM